VRVLNSTTRYIDKNRLDKLILSFLLVNKDKPEKFRIGITTSQAIFLDLEPKDIAKEEMNDVINYVWRLIGKCKVLIFETSKGYHLIFVKKIDLETFKYVYSRLISDIHLFQSVDIEHVYCSRKYMKTTLRISPKLDVKARSPKLIKVIE